MRILISLLLILSALPAMAQNRLALVIGNDNYAEVPVLDKAVADARAVAETLRGLGFETIEGIDLDRRETNRRISNFTARLQPGDTAFVFYAGHGVEIDGENYLLPTDIVAPKSGESDFVKSESIALSDLLDRVRATGASTAIAIIDACRNNPFQTATGRSIGGTRGLGRIIAPQGTFVIFSAGAGQLALDRLYDGDTARNSVFTRALLPRLTQPGLELRAMMADLRVEVRDLALTVSHAQVPAYYDELLGEFYFAPAAGGPAAVAATPAVETAAASVETGAAPVDRMRADLDLARSIGTTAAMDGFLQRYQDRSDAFPYQVALQLRDGLAAQETKPVKRETEVAGAPQPDAPGEILRSSRDIIADTQRALNAAGCAAGTPDGIIGPRTRAAFRRYLDAAKPDLAPADLGNSRALAKLQAVSGRVCPDEPARPATRASAPAISLTGTWKYRATCALVVKVTGSVRFRRAGANKFTGNLTDSLGQNANSEVFVNDSVLTGTDYFPGITVRWRGKLAADGNSYTASGSTGCAVYAWRAG